MDFINRADEDRCIKYMIKIMRDKKAASRKWKSKDNQTLAIEEALRILKNRKMINSERGEESPKWRSNGKNGKDSLVRNCIIGLSGVDPLTKTKVDSENDIVDAFFDSQEHFTWGEWRLEQAHQLKDRNGKPIGYSDVLKSAITPTGGGASIHCYESVPPPIKWQLTKIKQKKIEYYIGKAVVCEIDAVCSVPSLPDNLESFESGLRVLSKRRGADEWQRKVSPKRLLNIAEFIKDRANIIANSAILFAPPGQEASSMSEDGIFSVDFSKFLKPKWTRMGNLLMDHDFDGDKQPGDERPVWLIDGQHRTRGLSITENGAYLEIPIILFTDPFSLDQAAKVFAEINTLQKSLDVLHTLFMQHRFKIKSQSGVRDFRPWKVEDDSTWDSRANNLSYECAGWLASRKGGPLEGKIKILESNNPSVTIIKANAWLDYSRGWFTKGGPYAPGVTDYDRDTMFQEVENYFQAFVNTCNHGEWPDGEDRWTESGTKGIMQSHGPSNALLLVFEDVHEVALNGCSEEPIPIERFEEVLSPLKWADWTHPQVKRRYKGSGETPRTSLRTWIKAAVRSGNQYPLDDVMSEELKSKPGRGLLSPPEDSPITVVGENTWPEAGPDGAVTLQSTRPHHSMARSLWSIKCNEGKFRIRKNPQQNVVGEPVTLTFPHEAWVDEVSEVLIRVEWFNVNTPEAHHEITLTNPNRQ